MRAGGGAPFITTTMHTTEQAKALWCPMGRVGVMPSAGGPAGVNDPSCQFNTTCQGDQCAMWRWATAPRHARQIAAMNARAIVESDAGHKPTGDFTFAPAEVQRGFFVPACWVETQASVDADNRGYCGLAGSPTI